MGFRVWDLGFKLWGLGFRVSGGALSRVLSGLSRAAARALELALCTVQFCTSRGWQTRNARGLGVCRGV